MSDVQTQLRVEISPDPLEVTNPRYYDISNWVESAEWGRGKQRELDDIQPGFFSAVFDDDMRRLQPGFLGSKVALTASGNEIDDVLRTAGVKGDARPYRDMEFYGDFEAASAGTATGWSSLEADDPTNQFTTVTSPLRVGTKAGKFTVRSGDQYLSTAGERSEVTRTSGVFTGDVDGLTAYYAGSVMAEGPWQHPASWEFFHQIHADSRFEQAPIRLQVNDARTHWEARLRSGAYANGTAAGNSGDSSTDLRWNLMPFEEDVWFDWRYGIKWASDSTGWLIWEMKREGDTQWSRFVEEFDIQTLPSYPGQGAATTIFEKLGFYRNAESFTNVVYQDGYRNGHRFADLDYTAPTGTHERTVGLFPASTNLHPNGGGETNTSSWSLQPNTTLTRITTDHVFGSACLQVDTTGASSSQGIHRSQSLTNGQKYAWSAWVKAAAGVRYRLFVADSVGTTLVTQSFTGDGEWHRHIVLFTATANNNHQARIWRTAAGSAQTFYVDGAQLEALPYATPYIETNGGTATRNAARVQAPPALLDETQGWFAARVRVGFDSTDTSSRYLLDWRDTYAIEVRWLGATPEFSVSREDGGSGSEAVQEVAFSRGDYLTVIGAWTATEVLVSVDGAPFTATANTDIATLATDIDIGSNAGANQLAGYFLWAAFGTGALTDDDAARLHAFGDTPPWAPELADLDVTMVWDGRLSTQAGGNVVDLRRRIRVTLDDGTLEEQQGIYYITQPGLAYRGGTRFTMVEMEAVDGHGPLASAYLPRMDPPEATTAGDVFAFDEPSLLYPLGERGGTKAVQHVRKKRKRREGESKRHYRRHGIRRWRTRETRPEAEGVSGPPGNYKNTPTLGEPGLVLGSDDTSVRFTAANSEYVAVTLEAGDRINTGDIMFAILVKFASLAADQCLMSLPATTVGGTDFTPAYLMFDVSSGKFLWALEDDLGGRDIISTTSPSVGPIYHVAGVRDTSDASNGLRIFVNGVREDDLPSDVNATQVDGTFTIGRLQRVAGPTAYLDAWVQWAGVYESAPSDERVMAHYLAARERGYPVQTAGERIAALSAYPLWDTDLIDTAGYDVQPVFQYGQSPMAEIEAAAAAEMPDSLYYFNGRGKPVYLPVGYKANAPYDSVAVTLADALTEETGDIVYRDADVDWDLEFYNVVPGSKDGGEEQLAIDQPSIDERGESVFDGATGLLNNNDADVLAIVEDIRDRYGLGTTGPPIRPKAVTLHGVDDDARPHIFQRDIGDLVRFKRAGEVGDPFDVNARIIGTKKSYAKGQVTCTWNLARAE